MKAISLGDVATAVRRMPAAMWTAYADGCDRGFKGFWKAFRAQQRIKRTGAKFTLTLPRAWPIHITTAPSNPTSPNWSEFRARLGTKSEAAIGLEAGGTVTAGSGYLAIPLAAARTARGRVRPNMATPQDARDKRGMRFLAVRRNGKLLLYPLVKAKGRRGRPRKGARRLNANRLVKGPAPAYALVKQMQTHALLGFGRAWKADQPNFWRRLSENVQHAAVQVLAGQTPKPRYAKRKGYPS